MTRVQAEIIVKKRKECDTRIARRGGCTGRCSICPLFTKLDEYIAAKRMVQNGERGKQ